MLDDLTPEQRAAVTHPGGPLLVVAGAGAGKTRVLCHRVAWLVEQGAGPDEILALTFSSKAAEELRSRAEALLGRPHETLRVMTFHAFAGELARVHGVEHGLLPPAAWAGDDDRALLMLERLGELDLVAHDLRGDRAQVVDGILRRIDRCKNELVAAGDFVRFAEAALESARTPKERHERRRDLEFARAYAAHDRWLAEAGLVDYGEAIVRALGLLRAHPDRLAAVREGTRHVLIDEFQDTDHAQAEVLYLLADGAASVVAVGDDDQGIYRFRGASTKNIADFRQRFPDRAEVRLELNHRSPQAILDAAHAVVAPVPGRAEKRLVALPGRDGPAPGFWVAADDEAQARAIAAEVVRLAEAGVPYEEQAVLMDSVRIEAGPVAAALEAAGVPYQVHGGLGLFERREVRLAMAWLRALADPSDAQAYLRLAAQPELGIPWARAADAVAGAAAAGAPVTGALLAVAGDAGSPLESLLDACGPAISGGPADELVGGVLDRSGLRAQALALGGAEGAARLEGLAALQRLAADLVRRDPRLDGRGLVRRLTALSEVGHRGRIERGPRRIGVQVQTIHQAKGLEFDAVFVIGLHAARMPGRDRRDADIPDELLPESIQRGKDAHVAERRRLVYVALTRARRQLVLSTSEGGERGRGPSLFYEEARAAVGSPEPERVGEAPELEALHAIGRARAELERVTLAAAAALAAGVPEIEAMAGVTEAVHDLVGARAAALAPASPPDPPSPGSPPRPPGIAVSPSDLATYATCPLRYRFAMVDRIPQREVPGSEIGKAAHAALEAHYRPDGTGGDGAALVARFERELGRRGVADTPEGRQAMVRAREHLPRYHEQLAKRGARPVRVEWRFTMPVGAHTVRGRVDRIDRHPSGGFQLVDYKTGSPPRGAGVGDESMVLALYIAAATEGRQVKVQGARLEFVLDGDARQFDPDPAELAESMEEVRVLADGISLERFDPTPGWHCRSCEFALLCPAQDR